MKKRLKLDHTEETNLGGFTLLRGKIAPGQCNECAVFHNPTEPHNQRSLYYLYSFREQHGRWPTWKDAMAHCAPEVQQLWTDSLKEMGITV
jgi:hypothetical protein